MKRAPKATQANREMVKPTSRGPLLECSELFRLSATRSMPPSSPLADLSSLDAFMGSERQGLLVTRATTLIPSLFCDNCTLRWEDVNANESPSVAWRSSLEQGVP